MKTVTLEVTQQDIDRAIAWKRTKNAPGMLSMCCPIARAGRRKFHNVSQAYSCRLGVYKNYGKAGSKFREYQLDATGCSIIHAFDIGQYNLLKPCVVTLTKVDR